MRLRLLFIPIVLAAFGLQAQTINWVQKNGPLGGGIVDIEVDPTTGKIFLLDARERPFVSVDNGASWASISFTGSESGFRDIEISNGTIFLLASHDLYASTDGGVNFQARMTSASPFVDAYSIKRKPSSGDLVALCWNAIYTSTNDGQTWTPTGVLSQVLYPYLEVNAVDQIFILKQNTSDFTYRPFRSSDGGANFAEQSTGIPVGKDVMDMAMDNTGSELVCITNVGMYSSPNGTTWSDIRTVAISDEFISDYGLTNNSYIEFSADGLGMFFVDNLNHKLYSKSVDATEWVLQSDAFPSGTLSAVSASAKDYPTATSATAFFGTESGVFRTTTGGASVTQNNKGIAGVRAQQILADNSGNLFIKTLQSALLKSQDQGNNWARITSLPTTAAYPIEYFFQDPEGNYLYARVDVTLYRSMNQGSSWSALNAPAGGLDWAAATTGRKVFGLQNESFYYSADDGISWTATPLSITGLPTSFFLHESDLDLASPEYLLTFLFDGVEGAYGYYAIRFTYDTSTDAITSAVANKITNFPMAESSIHRVSAANGRFYVYGNSATSSKQIAISADGGATWVTRPVPASQSFISTKNGYLFFINGSSDVNKIYISRDDGVTFIETTVPSGVRISDVRDIAIDNSGYAYLAFDGGYLYQSAQPIVLPSPLTDLQEVGRTATAVALRWQDVSEYEHNVVIERSLNGTDFTNAGLVNGRDLCFGSTLNYFVDTNAEPATTYIYRIKSKNEAGESAPTSTISVTTLADCAQTLPANRSWNAINSGTESYALLGAPTQVGIKYLGEGKYQISDLSLSLTGSPEKSTFHVSCDETMVSGTGDVNPNGNGTWDGVTLALKWRACPEDRTETILLTLAAADPIPTKPAALLAYVVSNTSIELQWRSAYYEESYVLERSTSADFSTFDQIATPTFPTTTFIDDVNLVAGTTYYYRIKSINASAQESPYSDAVSVPLKAPNFVVADNALTNFKASVTLGSIWADFNNDGLEDYFTMQYDVENERGNPAIFKNLGNGVFETNSPVIGDVSYTWPSVADIDNDHYPDLVLAGDNTRVLDIFKGNGDFTFTKVPSGQLGDLAVVENAISSSSLADINNDGLLDILAINQEDGGFILYRQNADHTFSNVFQGEPNEDEPLLSIWADYDNDGFQDVLLGNLDGAGGLHRNNGDETFTLVNGSGMDAANYFSAAWGDYDNDGNIDLFCGNASQNALYKNNGNGTFTKDVSTAISEANLAISASWGDFNNDGFLDLITAGFASTQTRLFIRDPSITSSVVFKKIITEKINDRSTSHYSVASADPDNNGLLDLALSAFIFDDDNGDALVPTNNNFYQNNNAPGNWSNVKLIPANGSTEAIGARITLTAGGKTQTREIATMSSLVSRNSTISHFGLGSSTSITNIQVRWPDGSLQNYPLPPSNELLLIEQDASGPVITSHDPANNSTQVSPNTSITIVFDELPFAINGKKIFFTKTGEGTPFTSVDVSSGTKTGNEFVYSLPGGLQPGTEYNVTIDAGAFRDRYANASAAVASGTWKFTTMNAPVITSLVPSHNATNVSALTTFSATFDKPVTAVAGKFVKLYKSTDLETPVESFDAATAVITENTVTFTPSAKLQRSVTYHVSIDAGAFVDASAINHPGLASSAWVFSSDPGPNYTVSPTHNAVDIAADASLQVTFSEDVTTNAAKKIKIMDGTTVVSESDVFSVGTLTSNVYTYPAPETGWPHNKLLKVTLDEGAFVDADGNDCAAVVADSWNFTTVESADVESPVISFTSPAAPSKGFGSVSPTITVTDNKAVNSVVVSIRKISGSSYTEIPASAGASNTFTVALNEASHFDATGTEFFITATDNAGNTARNPEGTATHKVYLSYSAAQAAIPTSNLGLGGQKQGWKIFAIPFEIASPNNGVTAIFNEISTLTDKTAFRLITYGTSTKWSEYPDNFSSLSRGLGYFINIRVDPGAIALFDNLQPAQNSRGNLFTTVLKPGWNMIGNPYLTQIDWADVSTFNELAGDAASLVKYTGTGYAASSQILTAYEGALVNNPTNANIPISIPFDGQVASGGRSKSFEFDSDIQSEEWAVTLNLHQQDHHYDMSAIGMSPNASTSLDIFDRVTPPRFFDYLEVNFSHPEHFQKHFTREIVPTQLDHTWEFTVDSNLDGQAEISWDNSAFGHGSKELYLLDIAGQKMTNMRERNAYLFDPKESSRFKIYYGDDLKIAPESVQLGKAYPNPTNGNTTIAFSLPETGGLNQSVTLELMDPIGRIVGTIQQGRFNPGYHETAFDATHLMRGFYTYRLTVRNLTGLNTEVNKLIIK